ncbi:hypothetical protein INR49_013834 [Caranx melampygus]|nr:hypothetical protein INR49_013834 [Caranx melampygus]
MMDMLAMAMEASREDISSSWSLSSCLRVFMTRSRFSFWHCDRLRDIFTLSIDTLVSRWRSFHARVLKTREESSGLSCRQGPRSFGEVLQEQSDGEQGGSNTIEPGDPVVTPGSLASTVSSSGGDSAAPTGGPMDKTDFRTDRESTGCQIVDNNNVSSDLKDSTDPNNNYEDDQNETVTRDNFNLYNRKSLLKPCQDYSCPADSSRRDRKLRKSVSFDDDVTVYLFDQETPTVELHSEPCTSLPSSSSCTLPDVTLDYSGLEWEDDFSTLEKNCHYRCVGRSRHHDLSLPTQSWAAQSRPERYSLSQNCLFLTHVTESDLEL